jgi:hypothetical protein
MNDKNTFLTPAVRPGDLLTGGNGIRSLKPTLALAAAVAVMLESLNVKRQERRGDWRFLRRQALVPVVVAILLGTLMAEPATAKRSVHFRSTDTGASISSTLSVFKDHDSLFGSGAGVLTLTSATSDRGILYYGNATQTFRDKFKLGAPNAQGIARLSGSGHTISGTGRARGLKSRYMFTGTFDTKTGVYTIHLIGTYTFT